jgi:hypothetical protein
MLKISAAIVGIFIIAVIVLLLGLSLIDVVEW